MSEGFWSRVQPTTMGDRVGRGVLVDIVVDCWKDYLVNRETADDGAGITRVLEAGCGTGYVARGIADRQGISCFVDAVDNDPEALAEAIRLQTRTHPNQIRYVMGDVRNLSSADESYALVTSASVLPYLDSEGATSAIQEMHRVLVPGGFGIITMLHPAALIPGAATGFRGTDGSQHSGHDEDRCWLRSGDLVMGRSEPFDYATERKVDFCYRDIFDHELRGSMYHRPLGFYVNAGISTGLTLNRMEERTVKPEHLSDAPESWGNQTGIPASAFLIWKK